MESGRPIVIKELYRGVLLREDHSGYTEEAWELLYLLEGSMNITAGEKLYSLKEGDSILFAPRTLRCLRQGQEAQALLLAFEADDGLLSPFSNCAFSLAEERGLAERLRSCIGAEDPLDRLQIYPLAELLLLQGLQKEPMKAEAKERDGILFTKAVAFMGDSLVQPLSLNTLAEHLAISLSHLKRIFARYAGIGAHEYFTELRIAYAKELLEAGRSVTETAALTGFANQAYFSAAFKKCTGRSPKEFRTAEKAPRPQTTKKPAAPKKETDLPSYLL